MRLTPDDTGRTGHGERVSRLAGGLSVVIAEPDFIVSKSIENWIKNRGCSVISTVTTGTEILRAAEERQPDLVVLGVTLKNRENGIDIAHTLLSTFGIPSVLVATSTEDILRAPGRLHEIAGYIVKPFGEGDLILAMEISLAQRENLTWMRQQPDPGKGSGEFP